MKGTTTASEPVAGSRIDWIDGLRVLACFMVVFSHCCDGFVAQFDADPVSFLTGVSLGSLMRPSVPLFVMITGVLLLPVGQPSTMGGFYRKRLGRIVVPLVFWSLALPVLAYVYFRYGDGMASANPSVDMSAYTPEGLTNRLWTWILNFNFDTTPLWYLYMLVGLYLVMPIVGRWIQSSSRAEVKLFLKIWFATLFIPYIKLLAPFAGYTGNYGNLDIFGGCDWNAFSAFYYVSGFIGYLILGYYLKTYPLQWSRRRCFLTLSPMWLIGYAVTVAGYIVLQQNYPGNYAYLEIIWLFTGINVFMMTLPVFVVMQRLRYRSNPGLRLVAKLSFGIYLCHFIFVMMAYDIYDAGTWAPFVRICLMSLTVFAAAATLTWILYANRFTARLVK